MASIKYGGGVVGMAGKIAGNVFARNRYGSYVRGWAKPTNQNTARQMAARALVGTLGTYWDETLTIAQRQAWNEYAAGVTMVNRLGESMTLSGFNQFVRSNAARLHAGLLVVADAPTIFSLAETDPSIVATATATTNEISLAFDNELPWAVEPTGALLIHIGHPVNGGKGFFNGPYRYATKVIGIATTKAVSPVVVASPYILGVGQRVDVQCRIVRADGRLSNFFRCTDIVA